MKYLCTGLDGGGQESVVCQPAFTISPARTANVNVNVVKGTVMKKQVGYLRIEDRNGVNVRFSENDSHVPMSANTAG